MMAQIPSQSGYERLAGRRSGHRCPTPRWLSRLLRGVRAGDVWTCACQQRWRWGRHPLAVRFGFLQSEWVRL